MCQIGFWKGSTTKEEVIYILNQAGAEREKAGQIHSEHLPNNVVAVLESLGKDSPGASIVEYWDLSKWKQKDLETDVTFFSKPIFNDGS